MERSRKGVRVGGCIFLKERIKCPVFLGLEILNFPLSLHNESQGDALHPPRTQSLPYLLPENGTHLVADDSVKNSSRLLRFKTVPVDLKRSAHGIPDSGFRYFVYKHPLGLIPEIKTVGYMPRDCLPFPVRIRGQINFFHVSRRFFQILKILSFALYDGIVGLEIVLDINSEFAARKIYKMPRRSFHAEIPAEIFSYCSRL